MPNFMEHACRFAGFYSCAMMPSFQFAMLLLEMGAAVVIVGVAVIRTLMRHPKASG